MALRLSSHGSPLASPDLRAASPEIRHHPGLKIIDRRNDLEFALAGETGNERTRRRDNYHLFQPLLYQVATAGLSPADIASPIRSVLSRQANATVILAEVDAVDPVRKVVHAEDREIPYDRLIIATGAKHSYFSHDDWAQYAPGLKSIDDATFLRRRVLLAFEKAEVEDDRSF